MIRILLGSVSLLAVAAGSAGAQSVDRGQYNSTPPTLSDGSLGNLQLDANGNLKTVPSGTPSGTQDVNLAKVVGATTATGHGTAAGAIRVELPTDGTGLVNAAQSGAWTAQPVSGTTGGASIYHVLPGASDNHATIKNGAGTVYQLVATNNSVTANYVRLYDAGTGFNGCNSATGILAGGEILPSGGTTLPFGTAGVAFSTGLSICVTGAYGDTDTTNATNTALIVNVAYK